jgi:hypothetical protein
MATKKKHLALKTGLGIAAVAAAAGAYYFFGPKAKQNRRKASAWANKAKKELLTEIAKLKAVSNSSYAAATSRIMKKYKKFQSEHPEEFAKLSAEMKSQWKNIQKHLPKSMQTLATLTKNTRTGAAKRKATAQK